jgi:hypothetical protein
LKLLGKEPPGNPMGGPFKYYIPLTLKECAWYQVYDILETIADFVKQELGDRPLHEFSVRINSVLGKEGIPWKLSLYTPVTTRKRKCKWD